MNIRFSPAAALFLCLLLSAMPAAHASEPAWVTTVEGISEYRLDNGLRVLLMPDTSRPTLTVNVTYFVGSKHEGYGETGMAHLLEHMLFYGTPDHPDITAEISERGGFANGTTWYDRTNYFQTLPAEEDNLVWALSMEADRMVNASFTAEDLASEMTVVRNEYEGGENHPFSVLLQRTAATAYLWHGYGRSTIGARSDIENVPAERLRDFYRKYYQPDNAMVVMSGNFDSQQALELINRRFGAIPAPDRENENILWPTYTREPVQDGERELVVRRAGHVQLVLAAHHVPAGPHPDFPVVEVLSFILGDMPSGRLYKALVETELASQVGAFVMRLAEPSLLFTFAQTSGQAEIEPVRGAMLEVLAEIADNPPSEEEVTRAVNALKRQIELNLNNSERVGVQLTEWAANGDWRLMFLNRDRLDEVTPDDLARVARTYLLPANRTVGLFIPESDAQRAEIPETPDLAAMLDGYEGRADRVAGETFEATADNIEARAQRFELASGARVVLLPKQTRGSRVTGNITLRIGNETELTGLGATPTAARDLLLRGSENYSRQGLRDRMDELQASINLGPGAASVVPVSFETRGENLDDVLELVAEILRRPVFPENELAEYRRQALDGIDQQRNDPHAVAGQLLARHFEFRAPEHPFYAADFDEQAQRLRALSRDDLAAFHTRLYGTGEGTTIVIVGDFEGEAVRSRLENLFGDWQAAVPFQRIPTPHIDVEAGDLRGDTPDRANAILLGRVNVPIRDDHPDTPALELGGYLIGGGFLSSRLARRIRQQEGISYSVGGRFTIPTLDNNGQFFLYAMYNPENRERLRETLFEELDRALADGFEDEEFESGRRGWLQLQQVIRGDDARLAAQLESQLYLERDMHYQAGLEARVQALTPDDVVQALRRHLDPARITLVEAGDFSE